MNDYDELITKLDTKMNTHPNISSMWKKYIQIKREKYLQNLTRCRTIINKMDSQPDIDYRTLVSIYIIYQMTQID